MKSEKLNKILEHEDLKMYGFDERLEQSNIVYPPHLTPIRIIFYYSIQNNM